MPTAHYDMLRHFADSWGLIYMMVVFLTVVVFLLKPGAKSNARQAALIPITDDEDKGGKI